MSTARRALDAAMTERQLQDAVLETAITFGWLAFHFSDDLLAHLAKQAKLDSRLWSMMPEEGFLDTWLVHPARGDVVVAECKTMTGRLTPEQEVWFDALKLAEARRAPGYRPAIRAFVWRPANLSSGEIDAVLSGQDIKP